ncbi:MAG: hypothetical protein QM571_04500 [Micrococcaceae bacterium]
MPNHNRKEAVSRRSVTKGAIWTTPLVVTAINTPALAASLEETDDVSILNYQVVVVSGTTANLVITNTDTAKKWVSDSLWAYHGVFTWPVTTITLSAPIIIDGVYGTRQLNRTLRVYLVYFNLGSRGSVGIEPETTLTLPMTLEGGFSFTPTATDSVGVTKDIYLTANGTSYYPGDAVPVGGNISITVYRE